MSVSKEVFIMDKTIFEQMGGTYTMQGDYCLPDLTLPPEEEHPIGVWDSAADSTEAVPQNPVLQSAHFRQAPLPSR